MRLEEPAKLDIHIKSDWLLICLTFVAKSPGRWLASNLRLKEREGP